MNVAIFGAGIAGLATAAALRANGHECRIYEPRAANLENGMAFILMPDAITALAALGVRLDGGRPLHRYLHRNSRGDVLAEHPMPTGARCMRRRDTLRALADTLPRDVLVTNRGGLSHFELDAHEQVMRARLSSGNCVEADVYVAADGVRSQARASLFPQWPAEQALVLEVAGLIEDHACTRWAGEDFNKFHADEGGLAFGILPTSADTSVWYLQFDAELLPAEPPHSPQALRNFVASCVRNWADPVAHVVASSDFSMAHLWRPVNADPPPLFHRGNVVLVGDAAHPLLPFSSQGVSSAILDAMSLARLLGEEPRLSQSLARYSRERRHACLPFIQQGRTLTERFLSPTGAACSIPIAK